MIWRWFWFSTTKLDLEKRRSPHAFLNRFSDKVLLLEGRKLLDYKPHKMSNYVTHAKRKSLWFKEIKLLLVCNLRGRFLILHWMKELLVLSIFCSTSVNKFMLVFLRFVGRNVLGADSLSPYCNHITKYWWLHTLKYINMSIYISTLLFQILVFLLFQVIIEDFYFL